MFEVKVIEKENQEVVETLVVSFKEAEAIFSGYENDEFYSVIAKYVRQLDVGAQCQSNNIKKKEKDRK